ncbi:hypothetical protein M2475_000827 [Breznakia sp. PF5-3]|uniref:hypothetical protein n=1 Tax=unclassified Breznakia TaxID=2623764 RepID=UPI002405905B|nr:MULTISPECIES: hypothetical protein [unclassified Breznakia]MDF9824455.1 hypothetical protein [Breznakia sp. PM6-1]MDF9835262.1 hypothetical protein [Breznakia sp. PF5-3]MDF9837410.1 hypothetical protein [Breznakia sp. PFB2-8]MDF9859345.1 hypothetical protein [Breznakia sp. PH5-24]
MNESLNDWYIDRASNVYVDGFEDMLIFFYKNCKEKISSSSLSNLITLDNKLKFSKGNPNATLTHYRDIGVLNKENKIGSSASEFVNGKLDLSSLIIDLFFRRFSKKQHTSKVVRPFVVICKFFDILFKMEIDKDDVFLNSRECIKYLYLINEYAELDFEYVEDMLSNRIYDAKNNKIGSYEFKSNEATNINIWFNALRETPLFLPVDGNKENLFPNVDQREFFAFVAANGEFVSSKKIENSEDLYNYYCNKNFGITEILPRVILKEAKITDEKEIEKIFDYLFGYKMFKDFEYFRYFKYPCFGVYFPFISVPQIAIRQIDYDNPNIGNSLYQYLRDYKKVIQRRENSMSNLLADNSSVFNDIKCNKLDYNIQNLYFGAPGTGKSHRVDELIMECYPDVKIKDNPFVFKTTIYLDYSYYNFIGNIMPTSQNGEIGYDFKAGVFTQSLARACEYKDKEIFLIVEEMSRGNIASIFGDVFQLLDRDENGNSEYSINNDLISKHLDDEEINIGNKIYLPRNFHIMGTVNTSDQNVNVIDTAFKRRFEFIYVDVSPVYNADRTLKNTYKFKLADKEFEWNNLYMALNELITTKMELSEDKQIGQFFIKFNNYQNDEQKFKAIQNKLLHYLWDDVQGASISDEYSIFDKNYKTFSLLYKDFEGKKNVFSEELIALYDKQSL